MRPLSQSDIIRMEFEVDPYRFLDGVPPRGRDRVVRTSASDEPKRGGFDEHFGHIPQEVDGPSRFTVRGEQRGFPIRLRSRSNS